MSTKYPSWPLLTAAKKVEVPMACITWREMPPNGSKTGLGSITMRPCLTVTREEQGKAAIRWCGVDHGKALRRCCERRREAAQHRRSERRLRGFAVPSRFGSGGWRCLMTMLMIRGYLVFTLAAMSLAPQASSSLGAATDTNEGTGWKLYTNARFGFSV